MELMGMGGLSYWRRSNNNKKKLLVVSTRSSGGWLVLWFLLLVLMIIDDYNNYIINDDKLFRRPRLFVVGARQQPLVLVQDLLLPQQTTYQLLSVGAAHPLVVEEAEMIKINKKRPRRHQQRHEKDYFEKMLGISCKCITTACDDDNGVAAGAGAGGSEECNKMMISTSTSTTMGKQDCSKLECLPWKLS